jgi:solute carrier family 25 uncoupling protein 8/9
MSSKSSPPPVKKVVMPPPPMHILMLLSGTAASWGEFCTIPFDTAKVRLQMQDKAKPVYRGLFHTLSSMFQQEGIRAPWKGVTAGIQRQCAFAPIRIGLYEPVRNFYVGKDFKGDPPILQKIAAGLTTSAIGITIASPTDVVKVRLQAEGRLPPGAERRYNGAIDAYKKIVKQEGIKGLWTGYGPNLARNCVVNATELVAYDQAKQSFLAAGLPDNITTHILSGLSAGLAATLLGSPVDVIKTRVMAAQKVVPGVEPEFKGPIDCAVKLLKTQGPLGFYKGFIPNFARIGSWNIVTWVTLEQLKKIYWDNKDKF